MDSDRISSLIHLYIDGGLNRRELMRRLTKYTGTAAAALAAIEAAGVAEAQEASCPAGVKVDESDPSADAALQAYNRTTVEGRRQDMLSALYTIRDQSYVRRDRLGVVGFCAGGANALDLAANTDQLGAVVSFYGPIPNPIDPVNNMTAPLLAFFGERDTFVNPRLPVLLTALMGGNKRYAVHVYENAGHAFNNDTGASYNAAAACDAWPKTLDFFNRRLNA